MDRPDLQFTVKESCREMCKPAEASWKRLQRIGRYLNGNPQPVWRVDWQRSVPSVDVYSGANWAGCTRLEKHERRMHHGGDALHQSWAKIQSLVAKSSGGSELYGVVKESYEALGTMKCLEELGAEYKDRVHLDASAANGIIERTG